jgi:type III secretion protein L
MEFFKLPSGASYHTDEKIISSKTFQTFSKLTQLVTDTEAELATLKQTFIEQEQASLEKKQQEAYLEALTIFNQHVFALDAEVKTLRTHLMKQILPLALTAAKKIVGEQLSLHPETIVGMIQKQLLQCSSCRRVKLLVCKEDKTVLDENRSYLKQKLDQLESFAIEEDPNITPGSCIIQTEAGNINASLELQWQALEGAFARYMNQPS